MTELGRIIAKEMGMNPIEAGDFDGDLSLALDRECNVDCSPLDIETDRIILTEND